MQGTCLGDKDDQFSDARALDWNLIRYYQELVDQDVYTVEECCAACRKYMGEYLGNPNPCVAFTFSLGEKENCQLLLAWGLKDPDCAPTEFMPYYMKNSELAYQRSTCPAGTK